DQFLFQLDDDPIVVSSYTPRSDAAKPGLPLKILEATHLVANCTTQPRPVGFWDVFFDDVFVNASAVPWAWRGSEQRQTKNKRGCELAVCARLRFSERGPHRVLIASEMLGEERHWDCQLVCASASMRHREVQTHTRILYSQSWSRDLPPNRVSPQCV